MPTLTVSVDQRTLSVSLSDAELAEAEEFFRKMDRDMDRGWQMGPEFVERPDRKQRCQIAANRLLVALSTANEALVTLMSGYILARLPHVAAVRIDTAGEMQNTEFDYAPSPSPATAGTGARPAAPARGLGKRAALAEAGRQVSAPYKSGRGWRFAVFDVGTGAWRESAILDSEAEAGEARMRAVQERYQDLLGLTPS
jgi:hypothetical protein